MKFASTSRSRDPVMDRLESVGISQREREHARELLESTDRFVDFIVRAAHILRSLATPLKRVVQR